MRDNPRRPYEVARRAIQIFEKTMREATAHYPEWIESPVGTCVQDSDSRIAVARNYADEHGVPLSRVSCTVAYMKLDVGGIMDEAADRAAEEAVEREWEQEIPVAYTWQDEGWCYVDTDRKDPDGMRFYRCELKAREATAA